MRSSLWILPALALSSISHGENVKASLARQYLAVTRSLQTKNFGGIESILAPNFKAIALTGRSLPRAQVIKQFEVQATSVDGLTWARKIEKLQPSSSGVFATVSGHFSAFTKGSRRSHLVLDATTRDLWQKQNGKWMLLSTQLLKSNATLDGRPLLPK